MQEYCNGGSLRAILRKGMFARPAVADRWRSVSAALRGLAEGMAYTHSKRICHGDLNPSNVLLKVWLPSSSSASSYPNTGCLGLLGGLSTLMPSPDPWGLRQDGPLGWLDRSSVLSALSPVSGAALLIMMGSRQ